ncbi:MAG: response regulator [Candidatus Hydrogenedentes bacterium]|nr:response regulator [Candidatus Hydrogenedentota bacterium]
MALNILVVDDSDTVRAIILKTLKMSGIALNAPLEASNGAEALTVLKEQWVDLVLTDINMPEMGGVELIERMKEDDILKAIPVVVVSTEGSATRIEELKAKGVKAYVRKPFTPEQIREVVDQVLGVSHDGEQ